MNNFFKQHGIFLLFFCVGIFFRIFALPWGAPFYFHPDERQNIAYPVLGSHSAFMLDQQNFDNGTFPLLILKIILTIYTAGFSRYFPFDQVGFVILTSRIISAGISILILFLLYFIGKKVFGKEKGYLAMAFATFSVGFIQFSHFGTIEIWEALFFLLTFYYAGKIAKYSHPIDGVLCGIFLGFAISTKILSVILFPAVCCSFILYFYRQYRLQVNLLQNIKKICSVFFLFLSTTLVCFTLTSLPFLLNFHAAYGSIHFESDVALGKIHVFYTQGFLHTIPVLFQMTKVYPFLINPFITVVFFFSFLYIVAAGILQKKYQYVLICIFFLLIFIPESFLYVKWTRYMVPTLPFVYLIIALSVDDLLHALKRRRVNIEASSYLLVSLPIVISFIFAASFVISVYDQQDTRITASVFARATISQNATILSELFDPGAEAFNRYFSGISYYNFYDIDNNPYDVVSQLTSQLAQSDYIILPSQRLVRSRLQNAKDFPLGNRFYSHLFNGQFGFTPIYQTPCDIFCEIIYLQNPVFSFEETATVFDRPTVFIFKKTHALTETMYTSLLQ